MYRILLFPAFLWMGKASLSGQPSFLLPDTLTRNAYAVIRDYQEKIDVKNTEDFTITVDSRITVLNEQGDQFAFMFVRYDKFSKAIIEEATIYDHFGSDVKSLRHRDFTDQAITSNNTLYQDDRVLYYEWTPVKYPYTVHFKYTIQYHGTLNYTRWCPREEFHLSVEKAVLDVEVPKGLEIRVKPLHMETQEPTMEGNSVHFHWEVTTLPAIPYEEYSPGAASVSPTLLIGPTQFTFDGSTGTMQDWQSFGNWIESLWNGRNDLSPTLKEQIAEWKSESTDQVELARKIYHYVQTHTRYVSIQLGIGGYQPFPASYVEKYGYGDCKALVNFTGSMMEEAGIAARCVVIGAGDDFNSIPYSDFPSTTQANHVILCLPNLQDTIWLECTSQEAPFGYLGNFTAARAGLLIEPGKGGVIVHTPGTREIKSHFGRHTTLNLDAAGNASGAMHATYSGLGFDGAYLHRLSPAEQRDRLMTRYSYIPRLILDNVQTWEEEDQPQAWETITFHAAGYVKKVGEKWMIDPQPFSGIQYNPKKTAQRRTEIRQVGMVSQEDTIDINLPESFQLSTLPTDIDVRSPFGSYTLKVTRTTEGYRIFRHYLLLHGTYPPSDFDAFQQFLDQVFRADKKKWLLAPSKT